MMGARTPRIGSLFSGYGGLDLGLKAIWPDAHTVWVSDIDKGANLILAHRYPYAPNLGDITGIDWSSVPPVDIITGGFPCQDVSHAGRRAGLIRGETRTGLWSEMVRAIDTMRPRFVVAENVRGLLSARADSDMEPCPWCMGDGHAQPSMRALGAVLADLADIGYDAAWVGLRAADVGACHGRFRVFILAWPADAAGIGRERGWATRDGFAGLADGGCGVVGLPTPRATDGSHGGPNQRGSRGDLMLSSAVAQLLPTTTAMDSTASGGAEGSSNITLTDAVVRGRSLPSAVTRHELFGQYAPAIARHEAVFGHPAPSPVEPTGRGGANRLSPRFTEWMMGLPPGWITDVPGITRNQALKACGNGVVPLQAETAVRHLLDVHEAITGEQVAA